ncbi:hypothetical protein ACFL6N_03020 [Thermodesulfobacteriota bacterium]
MDECEHYEACLNDPTRTVDLEEQCRECRDISSDLLNNPELNDGSTGNESGFSEEVKLREELKDISVLLAGIENALDQGDFSLAGELVGTARRRLEQTLGVVIPPKQS